MKNKNNPKNVQAKVEQQTFADVDFSFNMALIICGAIILFFFFVRSEFWEVGMERDEGIYIYFGKLLLNGKVPYNDFYEIRLPGIFYLYALIVGIFGYSAKSVALGFTVVNSLSAIMLFFTAKIWSGKNYVGVLACLAFGLLSLSPYISGFTRQSEHLVNLFFIAALFSAVWANIKQQYIWFIASGIAVCMSIMIKPNAVYFLLPISFMVLINTHEKFDFDIKKIALKILYYAVGIAAPVIFFAIILLKNNAWDNFYQFAIIEAGKYAKGIPWADGKQMFKGTWTMFFGENKFIIVSSFLACLLIWFTKTTWQNKLVLLLLLISSWLTITPGLRFYNHYWLMLVPVLAMSAALLSQIIIDVLKRITNAVLAQYAVIALFFIVLFIQVVKNKSYYFSFDETELLRNTYGINPFPEIKYIGEFLNERKKADDKLLLVGSEPELYVYTNMDAATRHPYFTYIMLDTTLTPKVHQWQKEFLEDLQNNKPRFIVYTNQLFSIGAVKNSDFSFFNKFYNAVGPAYKQIGLIDMIDANTINYYFDQATVGKQAAKNPQQCIYVLERAIP